MPSNRKVVREKIRQELIDLADLLDNDTVFELSSAFLTSTSMDDDAYLPLAHNNDDGIVVQWDAARLRYHAPTCPEVKQDDWILLAMVMFQLYRMEYNIGKANMLRHHLSIFEGGNSRTTNDEPHSKCALPNLWHTEIEALKTTPIQQPKSNTINNAKKTKQPPRMKLGQGGLGHADSFDAFMGFYHGTHTRQTRQTRQPPTTSSSSWDRRSCHSQKNFVHILAEQATVQWAIHEAHQTTTTHLMELAAMVIRRQYQIKVDHNRNTHHDQQRELAALPNLLCDMAMQANGDGTFAKRVMNAMERGTYCGSTTTSNSCNPAADVISSAVGTTTIPNTEEHNEPTHATTTKRRRISPTTS